MSTYISQQQEYKRRGVGVRLLSNKSQLDLGLRELKFERELARMSLPDDARELLNMAVRERERGLEHKYNLVFLWTNLQKRGKFWELFGCKSAHEVLALLDLPNGKTLGMWEVLVRLFSRETFLLLGDEVLGYMTLNVARYQSDTELRKRDYQAIFDAYRKGSDTFDKTKFYEIIHWYINKTYVKPSGVKVTNNTARPPRTQLPGVATIRTTQAVETESQVSPVVKKDFVVTERMCGGCKLWQDYAYQLEQVIRAELGAKYLPKKPRALQKERAAA